MKKSLSLFAIAMLTLAPAQGQTLVPFLHKFADLCLEERRVIMTQKPDYNEQYSQLYDCLKGFAQLSLRESSDIFHPSMSFTDADFRGHLKFSPEYICDYMSGTIPDPYTRSFPFDVSTVDAFRELDRVVRAIGAPTDTTVYYTNAIAPTEIAIDFSYEVEAGEQQLLIITENNTPLEVVISSPSKYEILKTDESGILKKVWNEQEDDAVVRLSVTQHSAKPVSFVLSVY